VVLEMHIKQQCMGVDTKIIWASRNKNGVMCIILIRDVYVKY
jgi:hypothetical protein